MLGHGDAVSAFRSGAGETAAVDCGARHSTAGGVTLRIVLAAAAGESDVTIANQLSVNRNTVILWRKRFGDERLDALWDIAPGRGRKPTYPIDKIAAIVEATLQTTPAGIAH